MNRGDFLNYLSVAEVADLKGCTERYIRMMINNGKIPAKEKEKAANNRKEYLVSARDLPEDLQKKYYTRQKKAVGVADKKPVKKAVKQRLNTVKKAFEDYTADEREDMAFWIDKLNEWQYFRTINDDSKADTDALFVSKCKYEFKTQGINKDISIDILYRKFAAYKNDDYSGLIDNRGGWNKGKSSIPEPVWKCFTTLYLQQNKLKISRCYELTVNWVKEHMPEYYASMPSERTFRRRVNEIPQAVDTYARGGEKAFYDFGEPTAERDASALFANDVWIGDNHTLDVISLNDEGKPHRLVITAYMDKVSGIITGWNFTENPCSQSTIIALSSGFRNCGLPHKLYLDNGSEFLTHDIAGRGHRTKASWNKGDTPPTILSLMDITMVNALPRNARAKDIEGFFGRIFKNHFSRAFKGFCGGNMMEKPEQLKEFIKKGEIPTDKELIEIMELLIVGDYNAGIYGGKDKRYKGMTRIDAWNESVAQAPVFRDADEKDLALLLSRSTRYQKIKPNGVFIQIAGKKVWYGADKAYNYIGKEVYVRFNPSYIETVRVYDRETDVFLFEWERSEWLDIEYMTEDKDKVKALETNRHRVKKAVKESVEGYRDANIDILAATILNAQSKKGNYRLQKPSKVTPVTAQELNKINPDRANVVEVDYSMALDIINKKIEANKGV